MMNFHFASAFAQPERTLQLSEIVKMVKVAAVQVSSSSLRSPKRAKDADLHVDFCDKAACVRTAVSWIGKAAGEACRLVAFPEVSESLLGEIQHGSSLYMAQWRIDLEGLLISRRKLEPTTLERTVFGEGDVSSSLRAINRKLACQGSDLSCRPASARLRPGVCRGMCDLPWLAAEATRYSAPLTTAGRCDPDPHHPGARSPLVSGARRCDALQADLGADAVCL